MLIGNHCLITLGPRRKGFCPCPGVASRAHHDGFAPRRVCRSMKGCFFPLPPPPNHQTDPKVWYTFCVFRLYVIWNLTVCFGSKHTRANSMNAQTDKKIVKVHQPFNYQLRYYQFAPQIWAIGQHIALIMVIWDHEHFVEKWKKTEGEFLSSVSFRNGYKVKSTLHNFQ